MSLIVSTRKLTKQYGRTTVVDQLNLEIREGEIYGFLGPNGAGKSTTLKMLLGLTRPTAGEVHIFGQDLARQRQSILRRIGSLIESPSYYSHLTGLENMKVVQQLRHGSDQEVKDALQLVRLDRQQHKKAGHYSLGMKQRLAIAMALVGSPRLLILDEPTNGLDPAGMQEMRELIQILASRYGMTILISSHLLSEIEQLATSVGIIHHGSLIFQGSVAALQERSRPDILLRTRNDAAARRLLHTHGMNTLTDDQGRGLILGLLSDDEISQIVRYLVHAQIDVLRIEERKKSLEHIFLEWTGKGQSIC
ncbi:ABC transporter ATP-binding protein [Paenibacillus sp. FSL K6-1230]|uniref:ABC transporter ATP-binding protein n=1 Tax=Paenibacillus sp. FSL K6-1230 TaxID=2921603 RepID=UPI0030FBFEB0